MIHHISGRLYELREPLRVLFEAQAVMFEGLGVEPPQQKQNSRDNVSTAILPTMVDSVETLEDMITHLIIRQRVLNETLFAQIGQAAQPNSPAERGIGVDGVKHYF